MESKEEIPITDETNKTGEVNNDNPSADLKPTEDLEKKSATLKQNIDELSMVRGDKSTSAIGFLKSSGNLMHN